MPFDRAERRQELYLRAKLRGIEPNLQSIEAQLDSEERQFQQEQEEFDKIYSQAKNDAKTELHGEISELETLRVDVEQREHGLQKDAAEMDRILKGRNQKVIEQYRKDVEKAVSEKLRKEFLDSLDKETLLRIIRIKFQYDSSWVEELQKITAEAEQFWKRRQ
jgi:hypothetical protein